MIAKPFCNLVHFERDVSAWRAPQGSQALDRGAARRPLSRRCCAARCAISCPITRSISPSGRTRASCRAPQALSTSTTYIDYIIEFLRFFRGDVHVMAVCQPTVPVFAAVSLMEADGRSRRAALDDPHGRPDRCAREPDGGQPLRRRRAASNGSERNVITQVPWPYPGMMRHVYPGFLQFSGFMGMNFDRHVTAHRELFHNLIRGDGDSADKHREFYDEFLAVMDLTAEYYLQTIETVFLEHMLPKGEMVHRNRRVDPRQIRRVALMTVEGEKDDISGIGQTFAAHNFVHEPSELHAATSPAARSRPLWRVQRISLPRRNRAENQ